MPRTEHNDLDAAHLELLLAAGDGAPGVEQKLDLARLLRGTSAERGRRLDQFFVEQLTRCRLGLARAQAVQDELRALIERLTAPPFHLALFLGRIDIRSGTRALVMHAGSRRVVALAEDVDLDTLGTGDEVLLSSDLNLLVARSPLGMPRYGDTAFFERATGDGRIVLRWRDEEVVVEVANGLRAAALENGDQIRWDRSAWLAFERIERRAGQELLLQDVSPIGRDQVGGQDANLDTLIAALTASIIDPEKAARYRQTAHKSVLMTGPAGCGKTLMARVAAAEVARLSGRRCRFGVVNAADWESPWVGVTQQNIRSIFKTLRASDSDGSFAVLFIDEIEAVGRIRGSAAGHHSDKFLGTLLTEIDGFRSRASVAVIAATNRKDLLDPAIVDRTAAIEIVVGRPDMRGARAILDIHLPETLPYDTRAAATEVRRAMIDTAVSRLYSPNAENELCVLKLRDGTSRTVAARHLLSGRTIAQICDAAQQAAYLRDVRGGDAGLRVTDIEHTIANAFDRLASTLTPRNAHAYLTDLPFDNDVVSVSPVRRKLARAYRYWNAA